MSDLWPRGTRKGGEGCTCVKTEPCALLAFCPWCIFFCVPCAPAIKGAHPGRPFPVGQAKETMRKHMQALRNCACAESFSLVSWRIQGRKAYHWGHKDDLPNLYSRRTIYVIACVSYVKEKWTSIANNSSQGFIFSHNTSLVSRPLPLLWT